MITTALSLWVPLVREEGNWSNDSSITLLLLQLSKP